MENPECWNNPDQPEQIYLATKVMCKHQSATDVKTLK